MKKLPFCPECGNASLMFEKEKKFCCSLCNFSLYHNCASAVAVVIRHKDEILLTKRNQNPGIGKWDLPGGFVDQNEEAEEACAREIKEELGISLNAHQLHYIKSVPNQYLYQEITYHTLDLFFEYSIEQKKDAPEINPVEIAEVKWIKIPELNLQELAFESQKKFFSTYLEKKSEH